MVEIGLFVLFNIVAISGFYLTVRHGFGIILILSFVIFAGIAVWMFGGMGTDLQVAQTHNFYNSTGGLIGSESNVYLDGTDGDWNTLGMIYILAAGVSITWFLKVIVKNFVMKRRIKATGYWE